MEFSHVGRRGEARMVDVGPKAATERRALAAATLVLSRPAFRALRSGRLRKGSPFEVARLAGIQAAKRTSDLLPLCHPLRLDAVDVRVSAKAPPTIRVEAEIRARDRTGVEMEALVAVAVASLALYDMVKSADRGAVIREIVLLEKEGGRSGTYRRSGPRGRGGDPRGSRR